MGTIEFEEGYDAALAGADKDSNPHNPGSDEFINWRAGYAAGVMAMCRTDKGRKLFKFKMEGSFNVEF